MKEIDNILNIIYSYYTLNDLSEKIQKEKKNEQKRISLMNLIKKELPSFEVVDWTDLDDGVCYEYQILLHENQPILDDDVELLTKLGGKRKDLRLFISLLTNYYYMFIEETIYSKEKDQWNFITIYDEDIITSKVKRSIRKILSDMNYIELSENLAKIKLDNIETKFMDKGEVKVFNC